MYANYHTHTFRCSHAVGEDREYVESAIQNGMKVLGFSDHCPFIFSDGYISPVRMIPSETDGYFKSLLDLKKEYEKDIKIYIGFEAEYIPELMEEQDRFLKDYPVDYMILGQHFYENEAHSRSTGRMTSDENDLIRYVDLVLEGMQSGRYRYVAHPDHINYIGEEAVYRREMSRLCTYLKENDIPIEINLLGLYEGRHYPNPYFLKLASETGNKAIIGCDAHSPERLNLPEIHERCAKKAEEYGLELVDRLAGLD